MASKKISNLKLSTDVINPNTIYARWTKCTYSHLKELKIQWYVAYAGKKKKNGQDVWFTDGATTISGSLNNTSFSIPDNVYKVKFAIKPIAKEHTVKVKDSKGKVKKDKNGKAKTKTVEYWTAVWVSELKNVTVEALTPPVPTVTVSGLNLTARVDNLPAILNKGDIVFQVVENDSTVKYNGKKARRDVNRTTASLTVPISPGKRYKVRCKSELDGYKDSEWSQFSANTEPVPTETKFKSCKMASYDAVRMTWNAVPGASSYEIQWVLNDFSKFASGLITGSQTVSNQTYHVQTGLEPGIYWFRIRVVGANNYKTKWYPTGAAKNFDYKSCVALGVPPDAPTTWAELSTVKVGESFFFHWTHNSRDNSIPYASWLELTYSGGNLSNPVTEELYLKNDYWEDELHANDPWVWQLSTRDTRTITTIEGDQVTINFSSGIVVEWRVRTWIAGDWGPVNAGQWGSPYSVKRKVEALAPPVLTMTVSDTTDWVWDELDLNDGTIYDTTVTPITSGTAEFTRFPIGIKLETTPLTQNILSYTVDVIANESYDTINAIGEEATVLENESVFSKYIISDKHTEYLTLNANNIDLEDEQTYTIRASAVTSAGMSADSEPIEVHISWDETVDLYPNAEILIDDYALTASIAPYCTVEDPDQEDYDPDEEQLAEGVVLSVYRKTVDGDFVKIAENLPNDKSISVIDPHPTLGLAMYRIIAIVKDNGNIIYDDVYAEVDQPGIVITWDEYWSYVPHGEILEEYYYENDDKIGKMITLPYNVDLNQTTSIDTNLVNYIGRKRPVSYYGTQLGETITLKTDLPRVTEYGSDLSEEDEEWAAEMLALLRRLQIYTGDVYVRESTGNGYWANVKVTFDINHMALIIPVTINVTRVEGGA